MINYLMGIINILGWGIKPLFEKKGITYSNFINFANIRYIITAIICLIILLIYKKNELFADINKPTIMYSIIVGFIGLMSAFSNYYLLSKYDANYVIGIVEPGVIIVTVLFGYLFFNEKINLKRIIGILIVCIGIYVIFNSHH